MNFGNIFAYIELAAGIITAIGLVQNLVASPDPVTGTELVSVANPILMALQMILPKTKIPMDLVVDLANSTADVLNRYYKKNPAMWIATAPIAG